MSKPQNIYGRKADDATRIQYLYALRSLYTAIEQEMGNAAWLEEWEGRWDGKDFNGFWNRGRFT